VYIIDRKTEQGRCMYVRIIDRKTEVRKRETGGKLEINTITRKDRAGQMYVCMYYR
jgi:hypothetical protein